MAIDGYSLNGTALVYVGTGSAGALELLGYTEQGVDMDITENKAEIMTDLYGNMTPQDFQDMGMMARVVCPLIAYDRTIMAKVINKGDRTTYGSLNTPGIPVAQSGYAFSVGIAAPLDVPWYFFTCTTRADGMRLATKANPFRMEFVAWPWVSYVSTSAKNAPLFRRSFT